MYPTYFSDRFPSKITPGQWPWHGAAALAVARQRGCGMASLTVVAATHCCACSLRSLPCSCGGAWPLTLLLPGCPPTELSKEIAQGLFEIKMINKNGVVQEDPRWVL